MKKKIESLIDARVDAKVFRKSKKRTKSFISQSLFRFNSIAPSTNYTEESLPEKYYEILTRGVKIFYVEDAICDQISLTNEDGNKVAALLTIINHMEQMYLQELQLIKRED